GGAPGDAEGARAGDALPAQRARADPRDARDAGAALRVRHHAGPGAARRHAARRGAARAAEGRRGRVVNGILLVDKPEGLSSAGTIRTLKTRLGTAKVGHLGTLAPVASGLLPLCIGE